MPLETAVLAPDVGLLAETLGPILLRLGRRLRRGARALGLSPFDVVLLGRVQQSPGVVVSELADQEQVSRPSMSVHVKRLEAAGLIARLAPDSEDRRRIGLVITEAGGQTLQAILRHRNDWLASRLRDLPAEAHERLKQACEPLAQLAGERP